MKKTQKWWKVNELYRHSAHTSSPHWQFYTKRTYRAYVIPSLSLSKKRWNEDNEHDFFFFVLDVWLSQSYAFKRVKGGKQNGNKTTPRTMNLIWFFLFLSLFFARFIFRIWFITPMTHPLWVLWICVYVNVYLYAKSAYQSSELIPLLIYPSICQFVFSESNKYVTAHARIAHMPRNYENEIYTYICMMNVFFCRCCCCGVCSRFLHYYFLSFFWYSIGFCWRKRRNPFKWVFRVISPRIETEKSTRWYTQ